MPSPTIEFHGGVREVGGNKILVTDGADRLLFDFGPSFDPRFEQYYVDFLQPRSTSPVRDLLEFDLLPWIAGLYSREALAGIEERYTPPEVHAVFVSHAHLDHAGYLSFIDPDIPVHIGRGTRAILEANETSGAGDYGAHPWKLFEPGATIRVGGVEVVPYRVDHSIPHAFGFIVRTREGSLVYTGDFRQHGPRARATREFLDAAQRENPAALIIEGTRAGPDPRRNFTEEGVRRGVEQVLHDAPGLALASCYPRDLDRVGTLYRAAVDSGRDLVIPFRMAHLLSTLSADRELDLPVPGRAPQLKVYRRPKKSYYRWERPFLDEAVGSEELHRRGRDSLLLLDRHHFTELIDLRPPAGTPFIRSMSEPFSEEDVDETVFRNWMGHFRLALHQYHASGHCSGEELREAIRTVGAAAVYPVHTEHPEALAGAAENVRPPEKGGRYPLTGRRGRP